MSFGLESVSFSYGDFSVLERASWTLPERGVVCLWGASGCGKTTLLRLLAGLERPAAGAVHRPQALSVMFQEDRLLPRCCAWKNVAVATGLDRKAAVAALASVGLAEEAESLPDALSGGQRRRVALARALAMPGELMLLDEPFTGLDADTWRAAVPAILARAAEIPVVLVTHVAEEAQALNARRVVLEGTPLRGTLFSQEAEA